MNADASSVFNPVLDFFKNLEIKIRDNIIALRMTEADPPVSNENNHKIGMVMSMPETDVLFLPIRIFVKKLMIKKIRPRCIPEMAMICTTPVLI
jgi:hypothetical protein